MPTTLLLLLATTTMTAALLAVGAAGAEAPSAATTSNSAHYEEQRRAATYRTSLPIDLNNCRSSLRKAEAQRTACETDHALSYRRLQASQADEERCRHNLHDNAASGEILKQEIDVLTRKLRHYEDRYNGCQDNLVASQRDHSTRSRDADSAHGAQHQALVASQHKYAAAIADLEQEVRESRSEVETLLAINRRLMDAHDPVQHAGRKLPTGADSGFGGGGGGGNKGDIADGVHDDNDGVDLYSASSAPQRQEHIFYPSNSVASASAGISDEDLAGFREADRATAKRTRKEALENQRVHHEADAREERNKRLSGEDAAITK